MTALSEPLQNLRLLARTYYNQDWDYIVDTADEVVAMYADNRGPAAVSRAIDEIRTALHEIDSEADLQHLWSHTFGSAFSVPATGLTYRQWFEHLVDLLEKAS